MTEPDLERWARERPELAGREWGPLAEATPYLVVWHDELVAFWCRWPDASPVRVALPEAADTESLRLLSLALEAWEAALPGLQFAVGAPRPQLRIEFAEEGPEGAHTAADCSLQVPLPDTGPLSARLRAAEIGLRRWENDAWGRRVELSDAEFLGSALHEIGHALGLQGHARRAATVLSRNVDQVRKQGERVLSGRPLRELALRAVYALPSGAVVERRRLVPAPTRDLRTAAGEVAIRLGDHLAWIRGLDEATQNFEYYLKEPSQLFERKIPLSDSLEPIP